MSINKGKDKVKPYTVCAEHGIICGCPKAHIQGYAPERNKFNKRKQK